MGITSVARTQRSKLETRNGRLSKDFPVQKEPHWVKVVPGTFLGYARGATGSSWIARQRKGSGYVSQRIGTPDDHADADGEVVLTYWQAEEKAKQVQVEARIPQPRHYGDGLTVSQAVAAWLEARLTTPHPRTGRVMSEASAKNTRQLWDRHAGRIGATLVTSLDAKALRAWLTAVANSAPTKRGKALDFDKADPDQVQARRQSANRVLTIAKAALQHARDADALSDGLSDFWRRVKPFKSGPETAPRMMERDEITRLLNASPADLRELLTAALMTGARYGELAALKVSDYAADPQVIRIAQGKTGKVLWQPLTAEGARFFDRVCVGRAASETMLRHADGRPWAKSDAARPLKAAAEIAKVEGVSFKTTRATYGKLLLLATKDLELVAKALGHSDSRTTRRHYAALLPGELQRGIAKLPSLGIDTGTKVRKIRRTAA